MSASSPAYRNQFGRRWGRGARPWLLVGKLLGVSALIGGSAVCLLWLTIHTPDSTLAWQARVDFASWTLRGVILPGMIVAMGCGVLLLLAVGRPLLRMRWLQFKLGLLILGPGVLAWTWSFLTRMQQELTTRPDASINDTDSWMRLGLLMLLCWAVLMMILGRIKPRLRQDYAAGYRRSAEPGTSGELPSPPA